MAITVPIPYCTRPFVIVPRLEDLVAHLEEPASREIRQCSRSAPPGAAFMSTLPPPAVHGREDLDVLHVKAETRRYHIPATSTRYCGPRRGPRYRQSASAHGPVRRAFQKRASRRRLCDGRWMMIMLVVDCRNISLSRTHPTHPEEMMLLRTLPGTHGGKLVHVTDENEVSLRGHCLQKVVHEGDVDYGCLVDDDEASCVERVRFVALESSLMNSWTVLQQTVYGPRLGPGGLVILFWPPLPRGPPAAPSVPSCRQWQ